MRTSKDGLDLIEAFEGLRLEAYQDSGGVWTIGIGHTMGVGPGDRITETEAREYLREDLADAERGVLNLVTVPLRQSQFDALVSFAFNLGSGALAQSTLLKEVNRGRHEYVPRELARWVHAGGQRLKGLARRRSAEAVLYLKD